MHQNCIADHVDDDIRPEPRRCREAGGRATSPGEQRRHLGAVGRAKAGGIEAKQDAIEEHHALRGTKPLARASFTRFDNRVASARATAIPNRVMR